jgi:hypothetical protein
MTRIEGTVEIATPVERVFEYAADWRRWEEWFDGVSNFESMTDVDQGTGAKYVYRAKLMGLPAKVYTEIHDYQENAGWRGVGSGAIPFTTRWIFEDRGEGSAFTFAVEYELPVPLIGGLLDRLIVKPEWRRIVDASLDNLRRHFEG